MKKIGLILLWLLILVTLSLACWGLALYMAWPLWIGAALFLGLLGSYFLLRFLRRLWIVMRSRSKMTSQSEAHRMAMAKIASPEALLTKKWKEAVATLRNSNLKRYGNPLYALPWYMVIGKSGTGKSTALTRARLASPIQKLKQNALVERTLNCDWWYFDQAVVIDCAGRYVGAEDLSADKKEWEVGLDLLAKYRAREGLNGLVLAIAADRLIDPDLDALDEEGRVIRERIEQLIRLFGKRFPIYILVTKCDLLYGMESWTKQLPEATLEQAMGYLADEPEGEKKEINFLNDAFASIGTRLKNLRLAVVARGGEIAPETLLFPNELERLRPVLQRFLKTCLGSNPYLESPFLRGLFFSSGLQQGGAVSSMLGDVMLPLPMHSEQKSGLFLHDFFDRVLPQDRNISRPAALINQWYKVTQNLGLVCWLLLTSALGVWITVAFVHNLDTLNDVSNHYPFESRMSGRLADDALTMENISNVLSRVEIRNQNWYAQWMVNTTNIDDLEILLKQNYVGHYRKYIQTGDEADLASEAARLLLDDPANQLPGVIRNKIRHVNLLQQRIGGANLAQLSAMPQSIYASRYTPALFQRINSLYLAHLAWSPVNDSYLQQMLHNERELLHRVDSGSTPPLGWLVGLVASNGTVRAVTPIDFWRESSDVGEVKKNNYATVEPAYTSAGKKEIDAMLLEVEKSAENGPTFMRRRAAFESWYLDHRLRTWLRFAVDFPSGEQVLTGEVDWHTTLGGITAPHSPYYRLIDRLNSEFKDLPETASPEWLRFSRQFVQLRDQARATGLGSKAVKVVGTVNMVGATALKDTINGEPQLGGKALRDNLSSVDSLRLFLTSVDQVAAVAASGPGKAYQVAADFHTFALDPNAKPSGIQNAANALQSFKHTLKRDYAADEPIWWLIEGPFRFMLSYAQQQASCALQNEWDAKVQWPLQSITSANDMAEQLYGKTGTVWAFADGIAKPFLERNADRFSIVKTLGYSVPFTPDFLPMLNGAIGKRVEQLFKLQKLDENKQKENLQTQMDQLQTNQEMIEADRKLFTIKQKADALKAQIFPLSIVVLPTNVSPGAKAKPFATILTLQCAAGPRIIHNFNAPASGNFNWSKDGCGEVTLQIKVDDLVLSKSYQGSLGLVHFLQDFHDGERRFRADDFPASKVKLDALGINQIEVFYKFEGEQAIIKASLQLDRLNAEEISVMAAKQKTHDIQTAKAQQNLSEKLKETSIEGAPMKTSLPLRVGQCWDANSQIRKQRPVQSVIQELAGD